MKITWLGQGGLLFENNSLKIMIDPYFSDSVEKINPESFRRVLADEEFLTIKPDIMVFTHNHLDHYDPETVGKFITEKSRITVLSPASVWNEVRKIRGKNNYVCFNAGSSWTCNGVTVYAVKAEHSDPDAIGVLIDDGEKKYYITGDTLYNEYIFNMLPEDVYAVFLPVNGAGNNMNFSDALRFVKRVNPKYAVPVHFGMFDEINVTKWECDNKIIPKIYKEVEI